MANAITNGSFENGNFVANAGGGGDSLAVGDTTSITGWTVIGGHGIAWLPNGGFIVSAEDGNLFLDLTGYSDASPYGGVSQSITTVSGANYSLTFYLGEDGSSSFDTGPVSVSVTAGNQVGVTRTNSSTAAGNTWVQETVNFTATGTTTAISITGLTSTGGQYIGLDNVDVEPAASGVPEPAMVLPVSLAAAGFLWASRRKARRVEAR
jgi:hypothetical protein